MYVFTLEYGTYMFQLQVGEARGISSSSLLAFVS